MEITPEDVKRAQSDKDDKWELGNRVLYKLCHDYPYHKDDSVIIAKIWLIGRSYAAAVERRKRKNESPSPPGDRFYEQCVAPVLKDDQLDQKIDDLRQYTSIEDAREPTLELHNYLVTKLLEITHDHKRSLASKYLHFHLPSLFFIYDYYASRVLNELLPPRHKASRKVQRNYDVEYQPFFLKMLDLRDKIQRERQCALGPRELDRLLRKKWYDKYAGPI